MVLHQHQTERFVAVALGIDYVTYTPHTCSPFAAGRFKNAHFECKNDHLSPYHFEVA